MFLPPVSVLQIVNSRGRLCFPFSSARRLQVMLHIPLFVSFWSLFPVQVEEAACIGCKCSLRTPGVIT